MRCSTYSFIDFPFAAAASFTRSTKSGYVRIVI